MFINVQGYGGGSLPLILQLNKYYQGSGHGLFVLKFKPTQLLHAHVWLSNLYYHLFISYSDIYAEIVHILSNFVAKRLNFAVADPRGGVC